MNITIGKNGLHMDPSHRRPKHFQRAFKALALPHPYPPLGQSNPVDEIIDVRVYDTGKVTTVAIWIHYREIELSCSGKDNGVGYDRTMAAFKKALKMCDITIDPEPHQANLVWYQIRVMLQAIGESITNRRVYVTEAYG